MVGSLLKMKWFAELKIGTKLISLLAGMFTTEISVNSIKPLTEWGALNV